MSQALRMSASFSGLSSTMNREGVPRKRFSSQTKSRKGCGCPQKSYKAIQSGEIAAAQVRDRIWPARRSRQALWRRPLPVPDINAATT